MEVTINYNGQAVTVEAVSYTHLDVYKRQTKRRTAQRQHSSQRSSLIITEQRSMNMSKLTYIRLSLIHIFGIKRSQVRILSPRLFPEMFLLFL